MEVARQSGPGFEMAVLTGQNEEMIEQQELHGFVQDECEGKKKNVAARKDQKSD